MRLMESDVTEPVNVGNPDEVTVLQLAQEIIKLTDAKREIVHKPLPKDDPVRRRPDITRARTHLGWEAKVDRSAGLARTLEAFRERVAANRHETAADQKPIANSQ